MFDRQTASIMGKIGGSRSTYRKVLANRINPLKHGKYAKEPSLLRAITPTQEEKIIGITKEKKLQLLKTLAPALAAEDVTAFLENHAETLMEIKAKIARKEADEKKSPLHYWFEYADREMKFGEIRFNLGQKGFTQNQLVLQSTGKMSITDLVRKVCGEPNGTETNVEIQPELV